MVSMGSKFPRALCKRTMTFGCLTVKALIFAIHSALRSGGNRPSSKAHAF